MTTTGTSTAQDHAAANATYAAEHGFIMMARTIVGTDKAEAYDPATGTFIDPGEDGLLSDSDKRRSIDSLTCTEKVNLCQAAQAIKPADLQAILDAGNDRLYALILGYRDGSLNPESGQCVQSPYQNTRADQETDADAAAADTAAATDPAAATTTQPEAEAQPVIRGVAGGWGVYVAGDAGTQTATAGQAQSTVPQTNSTNIQADMQWMSGFISWLMQNPAILSLIQMSGQVRYTGI
jgi:hypothetical protein